MFTILRWWFTPQFPRKHLEIILSYRPQGARNSIRSFFRTWMVHPVKRRLAKYYLVFLKYFFGIKVVGITGSAGKTTTKEMTASILKLVGETVYSFANIDPVYNIPTTILKCKPSTKYLVLEMGIEYPGEMDFYLWLAKPDIGVITNIYPTHTLFLKNVKGVAKVKGKLVQSLSGKATAVLNSENELCVRLAKGVRAHVAFFGANGQVTASNIQYSKDFQTFFMLSSSKGEVSVQLPILGKQFVQNALAAAAVCLALGVDLTQIKKGLEKFENQEHRMKVFKHKSGAVFIDDSYNNNPAAAKEALTVFSQIENSRKKVLVFGDMLELGNLERPAHREIGKLLLGLRLQRIILVGKAVRATYQSLPTTIRNHTIWVESESQVDDLITPHLNSSIVFLFKGSRSVGLDRLIARLSQI